MKSGLYHKDVYLPKIKIKNQVVKLNYSQHAYNASQTDRYGVISLPSTINLSECEIIEAEIKNTGTTVKVVKLVLRTKYTRFHDLILVVIPQTLVVKTVWLNRKNDHHRTLDRKKYMMNVI